MPSQEKPLIYACSGCSNVAQMANYIALRLNRMGLAEMSCIAGVGGNVPKLVKTAQAGRPIIALDGCPLQCCEGCLKQHDIKADHHITLSEYGLLKNVKEEFDPDEAEHILEQVIKRTALRD